MKRKILPVILIIFGLAPTLHAQITKGSILLGGGLGLSSGNSVGKTFYFNIGPSAGVAVKQNLVLGALLSYSHLKSLDMNGNDYQKRHTYGAGIFIRQYVPVLNRLFMFGQGALWYAYAKAHDYPGQSGFSEVTSLGITLNIVPGISYALNRKWQLEAALNTLFTASYQQDKLVAVPSAGRGTYTTHGFSADASLQGSSALSLGFRFLFVK